MKKLVVAAATAALGITGPGATSASAATDASDAFRPASLKWHACSGDIVNGAKAYDHVGPVEVSSIIQCAELRVPLDYAHPNGQKITLQLTRTPHQGTGKAKGDIVVNPGGPGGEGALFGPAFYALNSAPMQAAYNVIGFDPRGIGFSKPAISCDTDYSNAPRPAYGHGDAKFEASWLKRSRAYADACDRKYGKGSKVDLLDHMKTIDAVRDMNTIRAALGHRKLDYYGGSYGTYLGQVYATVFPERVGKMVLDGNVGPGNVWYDAQRPQDVAFNENMDYYFGWIAKYDDRYHLGRTQAAVRKFYYGLEAELAKAPIVKNGVAVGASELVDTIQNAAYRRSQAVWHSYAVGLSAYRSGDLDTFLDTFGANTTGGSDDNEFAVYHAIQCTDVKWPLNWRKWHTDAARVDRKAPFYAWFNVWYNAPCKYWHAKPGIPVKVGHTRDLPKNILLFQATNDAATPYADALELHKILKGSHMVVQDGDRTHCIVHRGDTRPGGIDSYFDAYWLQNRLPAKTTVHVSQLGDPTPPSNSAHTMSPTGNPAWDVIKNGHDGGAEKRRRRGPVAGGPRQRVPLQAQDSYDQGGDGVSVVGGVLPTEGTAGFGYYAEACVDQDSGLAPVQVGAGQAELLFPDGDVFALGEGKWLAYVRRQARDLGAGDAGQRGVLEAVGHIGRRQREHRFVGVGHIVQVLVDGLGQDSGGLQASCDQDVDHAGIVPVERGRGQPDRLRDLPVRDIGESVPSEQRDGRREDLRPSRTWYGLGGQVGGTHAPARSRIGRRRPERGGKE
ncbi:hypothetical protein GCM10023195_80010 [Actinoallomurus liliacearum]|uniref:AB hydrolase-1 domain-containing protein n=1 Tax=Actinoallomurus liliacearum TaxID=1080073 RepID=A0ABP8TW11_9ACTN